MSATTLLAAAAAATFVVAVALMIDALIPTDRPKRIPAWPLRRSAPTGGWPRWRWAIAAAAGVLAWLVSGWPVAAPLVAVAVIGVPVLLDTAGVAARSIDRIEAVQDWARRLSDVLILGTGLEQAIITSVRTAPAPIRTEVDALAARLSARWPTETALRVFADELNDPVGDLVVAALILADRRRGPGLARALAAIADAVTQEVAVRRLIEADRAKPRATARAVTVIALLAVGFGLLNGSYLSPYATPLGQLVFAAIAVGFITALAWMRALTLTPAQPRILRPRPQDDAETATTGGARS